MGYFSEILAEPAAQQAARLSAQQLADLPLGWDIKNGLFNSLAGLRGTDPGVLAPWQQGGTGAAANESGELTSGGSLPRYDLLKDYTFDWQGGDRNSGTLTAYDSTGKAAGTWEQRPEQSLLGGLMEWGALAGAGFGGLGLAGIGPLGGMLGGLGGASAAPGIAGPGTSQLSAYGASLTPGQVAASVTGLDLGATGGAANSIAGGGLTAGGSYGTIAAPSSALGAGGAGLSSGAGLTAPVFSGSGLGTTAGIGTTTASGGLSGILGGLSSYLPAAQGLASIASGLYGMKLAGDAREASDPFGPYRAAFAQKLMALENNPGSIVTRPGFQAGLETIARKSAATGYYGSGNMASALSRYSGDFYTQEANRLAGLAGAGQTPGAGQFPAADLASQSLGSIGYGIGPLLQRLTQGG